MLHSVSTAAAEWSISFRAQTVADGPSGTTDTFGYNYDDNDGITSTTTQYSAWSSAKTVSYAYFADGLRSGMTLPSGSYSYLYDADRRPQSLTDPFGNVTSWTYKQNGWLRSETNGNGISRFYNYLQNGLTSAVTNHTPGGTVLADFTNLQYDGVGNLKTITASVPSLYGSATLTHSYGYDIRDRLTSEQFSSGSPKAVSLTGSSSGSVTASNTTLGNVGTGDFSVSAWIKVPSTNGTTSSSSPSARTRRRPATSTSM
jgi:YD repeat-containing protein